MKKNRIFRLLLLCGLLLFPASGFALGEPAIVVKTAQGATMEFFLADNPVITFQDNVLTVKDNKGSLLSVDASEVGDMTFSTSETTGIEEVAMPDTQFGARLSGLLQGTTVEVYSTNGALQHSVNVGTQGTACIDFATLPSGVYVVKTSKGSFKITNK